MTISSSNSYWSIPHIFFWLQNDIYVIFFTFHQEKKKRGKSWFIREWLDESIVETFWVLNLKVTYVTSVAYVLKNKIKENVQYFITYSVQLHAYNLKFVERIIGEIVTWTCPSMSILHRVDQWKIYLWERLLDSETLKFSLWNLNTFCNNGITDRRRSIFASRWFTRLTCSRFHILNKIRDYNSFFFSLLALFRKK
jgi:hypothetical protein